MKSVQYDFPQRIPVVADTDFLVVGGGPGGFGAAVAAAREGVKTLLVEASGALGGAAVLFEVHPFMPSHKVWRDAQNNFLRAAPLDGPLYPEWIERMWSYLPEEVRNTVCEKDLADFPPRMISKDLAALAMEDICVESGVDLLFHHTLVGVKTDENRVKYTVFHCKSGFCAIKAKVVCDSTGDGDLAALAGCEFEFGDAEHGLCQPMTLCFKLSHIDKARIPANFRTTLYNQAKAAGKLHCPRHNILCMPYYDDDVIHFNTTRVLGKSAINGVELSEAECEGRRQMREFVAWLRADVPGFEQCRIRSMGRIGIRESRRILGLAYLTRDDFVNARKFPDAIARSAYQIDIHSTTGSGTEIVNLKPGEFYEIPYGCIVPRKMKNLLIGARCISADHALHSSSRIMPTVVSIGQAAGIAAALSLEQKRDVPKINGCDVRERLIKFGAPLGKHEFDDK